MTASPRILCLALMLSLAPLSTAFAQGPALSPIANISLNAGGTRSVNVIAVDPADGAVTVTAALPPFATLNTPTIGTGTVVTSLTLTPSAAQTGNYSAAVTATAGGVSTVRVFQITVNAAGTNQAPVVTAPPFEQVMAGSPVSFTVTASDPDGDPISSLSGSGIPAAADFTTNGTNTSATFTWTPGVSEIGEYDLVFTAANGLSGSSVTHVTVTSPPTLSIAPIADVTVQGGGFASVPINVSGVPGVLIELTAALPAFATLNPPGSGTGSVSTTVTISPPLGSAGTYHAAITANQDGSMMTMPFKIIVTGDIGSTNHPPVLTAPATATIAIGKTLSFFVTATDPDSDHVDLIGSSLPPGSTFIDHANDTGTFSWTPVAGQSGTYIASFSGSDGKGGSGSASTAITVTGDTVANHPPTVSAPAIEHVNVSHNLSFSVTASDPDGDHVSLSASSLPSGATFSDHGDNTGSFSWTPGTSQTGSFTVAFLGFDGRGGSGTASTSITVSDSTGGGGGGGGGGGPVATVPGKACVIGKFKAHLDSTCIRINPINHSFNLTDVVLSSVRLRFNGVLLAPLYDARLEIDCPSGGHHGDDNGQGDDDHGGNGPKGHGGNGHFDVEDHGDDNGNDDCGVSCPETDDHHDCGDGRVSHGCDTLGVRACFSNDSLFSLFANVAHVANGNRRLPCALLDAQVVALLANGDTVVATFDGRTQFAHHGGDDGDDDHQLVAGNGNALSAKLSPNPLHPNTVLSFSMIHDGQVRVVVYDMQGRVVRKLLNEFRAAGSQSLGWDGTNESSQRVPSGVYLIRIQTPEAAVTRRLAVVR